MKKECSESEARNKAEAYCSSVERCVSEVEAKLEQWGADHEIKDRVIEHLIKEKYIDQRRYCAAFVRDKYRFNQWGRMKIVQALRLKKIPTDVILSGLVEQKKRSIKANTDYERNGKLIRFAIGRGFEMEEILRCVKQIDADVEYLD